MKEKTFHKIIKELCSEMNINLKRISYDWILELSKNDRVIHIMGNKFDLNTEAAGNIASDKYATYEILRLRKIPVIKHTMLFNPQTRSGYTTVNKNNEIINRQINKYKKIVIKPNTGYKGKRSVFV